jgi:hypothetical protein
VYIIRKNYELKKIGGKMYKIVKLILITTLVLAVWFSMAGFSFVGYNVKPIQVSEIGQDDTPVPEKPEEPEPEQPIATVPVEEQPPSQEGTGATSSNSGFFVGLAIGMGIFILVLLGVAIGRRSSSQEPPPSQPQ